MSEEKPKEPRVSKVQWVTVIIAVLGLLVAFLGVNFQNISSWYSETMFPKADFIVESWTTPTSLPYDFKLSLSVSPEYFVVTSVSLRSERPYICEPMQFRISFENKGKKSVEQPRVAIYFVDYMYRVWNVWNESVINDVLTKGCSLEYRFPPTDQKTVGVWSLFVLLYDDAQSVLVSYEAKAFSVTDVASKPLWQLLFELVAITGAIVVLTLVFKLITDFRSKRRKTKRKHALRKKRTEIETQ